MALNKQHLLYDMWFDPVNQSLLAYVDRWPGLLLAAAAEGGATIITHQFHQFQPIGVTGFLLLAESHISLHTWPEENLAALDIFSCGNMNPDIIVNYLRNQLHPVVEKIKSVERGKR